MSIQSYRVLHLLDHSWPVLDGYAQRSRSIVAAQAQLGFRPTVLTSPMQRQDDPSDRDTSLDGIPYLRTPDHHGLAGLAIEKRWLVLRELAVVRLLRRRVLALLGNERYDILHAHSPALCGFAAAQAARACGVPFVYEIRSFWEDGAVDQNRDTQNSVRYRLGRGLETHVVRRADAVVGIAQSILEDLKERGIPSEKLFHVPNGVDVGRFVPGPRDVVLARELGVDRTPVLGFLGTLFPWEGVSWLVRAAVELKRRGQQFKLLIVGDGADAPELKKAIWDLDAAEYVNYLGRVPHDQVERYYSVMDVLVYPRRSMRLTELVTPLKPLEAMALGKAVLGSSVGGLKELIEPEVTGLLFAPEDFNEFCGQASRLLQTESLRRSLGERARQKMSAEKDWKQLAGRYEAVYQAAIRNARSRS
jgi:PEP-CTERM/exosortase A-associated glycosyltransferase